jgi:hypothetical protein
MLLDCDKNNVRVVASLNDAKGYAESLGRIVWTQIADRPEWLYKVYPGGRVVPKRAHGRLRWSVWSDVRDSWQICGHYVRHIALA